MRDNEKSTLPIQVFFVVVGLIMILSEVPSVNWYASRSLACTESTSAVIVDLEARPTLRLKGTYYIFVAKYTIGSFEYIAKSTSSYTYSVYAVGDVVEVHYSPDDPTVMYFNNEVAGVYTSLLLCVVGSVLICGAVVYGLIRRRKPDED